MMFKALERIWYSTQFELYATMGEFKEYRDYNQLHT